jgi:hypothetical protein
VHRTVYQESCPYYPFFAPDPSRLLHQLDGDFRREGRLRSSRLRNNLAARDGGSFYVRRAGSKVAVPALKTVTGTTFMRFRGP